MTPERWQRVEELYHAAYATPAGERAAFLAEACREDEALRRQVESLLNDSSDDGFLATPTLEPLTELDSNLPRHAAGHDRPIARRVSPGRPARRGRHGRSVPFARREARARRRDQDSAAGVHEASRSTRALRARSADARRAEPSQHLRYLRLRASRRCSLSGSRAGRGRHARTDARARVQSHQKGGGLPIEQVLRLARQIAEALEVAHEKGIIHRDLKPANIKITPDGAVKILDFGLAKIVGGDGPSSDLSSAPMEDGVRRAGPIIGTAAYMSPEQARGLPVDKRTDIWAFGCVLYEMVTGRVTFAGDTISDSIAKILEREPDWSALPAATPAPIRRLLLRCLTKDAKQRLRDIGDVRIEIDGIDEALPGISDVRGGPAAPANAWLKWPPWVALIALAAGVVAWEAGAAVPSEPNPLANATFARLTDWEGTEEQADISPDGRFVTFVADKAGEFDVWWSQVGTRVFQNLTLDGPPMVTPGNILRSLGFNGDGSEVWFNPVGNPGREKVLLPLTGGTPRPFLRRGHSTPSWSPDNARLAFIDSDAHGDPLYLADRIGASPEPINVPPQDKEPFFREGRHTHNPVWSPDGEWIYFVYGSGPTGRMNVWRMKPSGASPEQLTDQHPDVNFLAPINPRTLLFVARAADWSGPWLWALDVESKVARRVTVGLEQYTSVSASRDGRRVVATVAKPTASLWRVPLNDSRGEDVDPQPYAVPTERALAPRHQRSVVVLFLPVYSRYG